MFVLAGNKTHTHKSNKIKSKGSLSDRYIKQKICIEKYKNKMTSNRNLI